MIERARIGRNEVLEWGAKGLASLHGRIELAPPEISGWQRWLLIRRSLNEGADPAEMAYVLIFAPTGTSLTEMVEADCARVGKWNSVLMKRKEK
jgi:hypothetical protein